jgi:hypothetical protein
MIIFTKRDLLVIVQVESKIGIDNIPEIGMVDGVDCIFLGPFDISCSIGKMGQFDDKEGEVMELIYHAEKLVRETSEIKREKNKSTDTGSGNGNGLILGGFRSPGRTLKEMFSKDVGYQLIGGSVDLGMIQNAAKSDLMQAKKAMVSKSKSVAKKGKKKGD